MVELDFKAIGKKIRERRKALGITQEAVANALDVNPSHISNIECGRANPSLTILVCIANILNCSVDFFISQEYTFSSDADHADSLESQILTKLNCFDAEKKQKVLKMLDIL